MEDMQVGYKGSGKKHIISKDDPEHFLCGREVSEDYALASTDEAYDNEQFCASCLNAVAYDEELEHFQSDVIILTGSATLITEEEAEDLTKPVKGVKI